MRGTVEGLVSPHPLIGRLPAVYREDGLAEVAPGIYEPDDRSRLTREFLSGLDVVIAPVFATLDSLEAYLDPYLTPPDFLPWLAGWVGLARDERWTDEQLRELMAVAIGLYRRRGTAAGIRGLVKAYTGVEPEVTDSGGAVSSPRRAAGQAAGSFEFPGTSEPWVRIRVTVPPGSPVAANRLRELLVGSLPVHVRIMVEVEEG